MANEHGSATTGGSNAGGSTTGGSRGASTGATGGAPLAAGKERAAVAGTSTCAFWLGERCFGIDVALVGEVVTVETIVPVPMARPAIRGIFNLRGTPVVLVSLAAVLGIDGGAARKGAGAVALVLRIGDQVVGLSIERMEAVIPPGRGAFTPSVAADEHPAVLGLLELDGGSRTVTVLAPDALRKRLDELRYLVPVDD